MAERLEWIYDNAGSAADWTGHVMHNSEVRAIALASAIPYTTVYAELYRRRKLWIVGREPRRAGSKRVYARAKKVAREEIPRPVYHPYLVEHGFEFHPPMDGFGKQYLDTDLPAGKRLVVILRLGLTAVIDHVILDIYDPYSRNGGGRRYGYYIAP